MSCSFLSCLDTCACSKLFSSIGSTVCDTGEGGGGTIVRGKRGVLVGHFCCTSVSRFDTINCPCPGVNTMSVILDVNRHPFAIHVVQHRKSCVLPPLLRGTHCMHWRSVSSISVMLLPGSNLERTTEKYVSSLRAVGHPFRFLHRHLRIS